MNNNFSKILILLSLSSLLFSCDSDSHLQKLKSEVAKLEQDNAPPAKSSMPIKIEMPKPILFEFSVNKEKEIVNKNKSITDPLLNYSLDALHFVGTISENQQIWAYLLTPDGRVYSVKENDIIGNTRAKITKISPDTIEVKEKLLGLNNQVVERTQNIKLRK